MPGLFDVLQIENLELKNRIMVSSMCQYMAKDDAKVADWHTVHYGSFALGGPALVMVEATAVESRGRISVRDLGIYEDAHVAPLGKLVEFNHSLGAKMGIQLAHAGRKAVVPEATIAPSALSFSDNYSVPASMEKNDVTDVIQSFVSAAKRAVEAGFDFIELHGAHGYLLHEFLSPLSNQRKDEYGGSFENRLRFVKEVIAHVVDAVAGRIPVGIRISASEYHPEGYGMEEVIYYCQEFVKAGIAAIDVSSGGNVPVAPPVFPGYQVPFAQVIKQSVNIPVIAVGILDDPHLAEHVIRSQKADVIAIARGFLRDKHWAHTAAKALHVEPSVPEAYRRAYV